MLEASRFYTGLRLFGWGESFLEDEVCHCAGIHDAHAILKVSALASPPSTLGSLVLAIRGPGRPLTLMGALQHDPRPPSRMIW